MRVLVIAPYFDRNVAGESYVSYRWVEGISERCDATVLSTHPKGWKKELSPTRASRVVNWDHHKLSGRMARFDHEFKPHYLSFYLKARNWIKDELARGERFDLVHQVNPIAMRYPCPAQGLGIKYILGPFGGGVRTPPGFEKENADKQWYRKLRNLDGFRLRFDPWLKSSYEQADLFIGVAPYVRELLASVNLRRFVVMSEAGADIRPLPERAARPSGAPIQLLFVGRLIRTKGVIDAIRAVAMAAKECHIEFNIVGAGDSLAECRQEASRLGVASIVHFHGRLPKEEVLRWYHRSDIFLFPSFREPTGQVLFEAMVSGLPVITSTVGGPGYIVDDQCGARVHPKNSSQYAADLSAAIVKLSHDPALRRSMALASFERMKKIADWNNKFDQLLDLYHEVCNPACHPAAQLGSLRK